MKMFDSAIGWDAARKSVRFTAARLAAEPAHKKHEKVFRGLLAEWNTIDGERRDADDALVDAHAHVAATDDLLDQATDGFARRLRHDLRSDDHPTFRKYFPESPSEIIRLGLESQLERSAQFHVVAREVPLDPEAKAILGEIAALDQRGRAVLAERVKAAQAVAQISLRVQAWKDKANAARRSLDNLLDAHALAQRLPRDYADHFFPQTGKSRRKSQPKGDGEG